MGFWPPFRLKKDLRFRVAEYVIFKKNTKMQAGHGAKFYDRHFDEDPTLSRTKAGSFEEAVRAIALAAQQPAAVLFQA